MASEPRPCGSEIPESWTLLASIAAPHAVDGLTNAALRQPPRGSPAPLVAAARAYDRELDNSSNTNASPPEKPRRTVQKSPTRPR